MIAKKFFCVITVLLVVLGLSRENSPIPNQKIELEFGSAMGISQETEAVVDALKTELQSLGVSNIQVRSLSGQALTISYYSDENIADIKAFLVQKGFVAPESQLPIPSRDVFDAIPSYAEADRYRLDIFELQSSTDIYLAAHGKYILDLHKEYDKSPNPHSFANARSVHTGDFSKALFNFGYCESGYSLSLQENISYEIPEVRAGPFSSSHSQVNS